MVISVTVYSYKDSKKFNVTMDSVQYNVLALKVAIRDYNKVELEHIRLLYGSCGNLEDWRTLAYYNIDHGCTVILTARNNGSGQ